MDAQLFVFELEKHPQGDNGGAAALVVAHSVDEALGLLGWGDATVNALLDYRGTRTLPWIVAQYNAEGELLVHAKVLNE